MHQTLKIINHTKIKQKWLQIKTKQKSDDNKTTKHQDPTKEKNTPVPSSSLMIRARKIPFRSLLLKQ